MLLSVNIQVFADEGKSESNPSQKLAHTYSDVQKYGDARVENKKESNAYITDPKEIKKLTNLGFTEDEIATFSVSEYERYKNSDGKVVGKSKKYFRVTKDSVVEITEEKAKKEVEEYNTHKAEQQKQLSLNSLNNTLLAFNGSLSSLGKPILY